MGRLEKAEGLADIQSDSQGSVRNQLFNPTSVLYTNNELRGKFDAIASSSKSNADVHSNFVRMVGLLNFGAFGSGGSMDTAACRDLLGDHKLLRTIWDAAAARPVQPRYAGSLREFRSKAIEFGVPENVLAISDWLDELEKTFFAKKTR